MIEVKKNGVESYEVAVSGGSPTHHKVKLSESFYQTMTLGVISPEEFIKKSFEFLLEREPNTSILSTFELSLIGRYFPEYEKEMKKTIEKGS